MAGLERRLELLETARGRGGAQLAREALSRLSDEDLDALEEALPRSTLSPGEPLPPNELIEKMKRWEAETIEQQHRR
jgi:hypothetical protein